LKEKVEDSYTVLLNKRKLPMSLIEEDTSAAKINILDYEKYEDVFGPQSSRTRPKINFTSIAELAKEA